MKENIVYGLRDPRNDVYYYIGKSTVGNSRALMHLRRSHSPIVNDWVNNLKNEGISPCVDIIEKVEDINDLSDKERYWINYYKHINPEILNIFYVGREINNAIKQEDKDALKLFQQNINNIHNILRNKRKFLGITATEAAESMGISRNTLYLFEKGSRSVSYGTLVKYINYLEEITNED